LVHDRHDPGLSIASFGRLLKDSLVSAAFGALSALEALCDYALYKIDIDIYHYVYKSNQELIYIVWLCLQANQSCSVAEASQSGHQALTEFDLDDQSEL